MKNQNSIALVLLICCLIGSAVTKKSGATQREDIIAEEYNFEGTTESKGAISYGLASTSGYSIPQDLTGSYVLPTFVKELPKKMEIPEPGPSENVEEIATTVDYYDGSNKLNSIKINCIIYTEPNDCTKQSSCGWCGSSKKCILGNNIGPLQACVKSSYIFSAPIPNFHNSRKEGLPTLPSLPGIPITQTASSGNMNVKVVQDNLNKKISSHLKNKK
tara:strand:- start:151 stop:801 length:651 start_codon:yes stop_codon:yes gene_type:complete